MPRNDSNPGHFTACLLCLVPLLSIVAGCGQDNSQPPRETEGQEESPAPATVRLWAPAGQAAERSALRDLISDFNRGEHPVQIELQFIPMDAYHDELMAAAEAGSPPDILSIDAPYFHAFASKGYLHPLNELLPAKIAEDLLSSIIEQGTYEDTLYAVATYDTGLGLFVDTREFLRKVARLPRGIHDSWTIDEFDEILAQLHEENGGEPVLDLKLNYGADWLSFAFAPVLHSAGSDFIGRDGTAEGTINSPEAVEAMERIQAWFENGYIAPNEDDNAFVDGRVAISWTGHWDFQRYFQAVDGHLRLLPLPDFGNGSRTNQGAWSWAIAAESENPEAAMEFFATLLEPEKVLEAADVTGGVPARHEAIALSSYFGRGADLHLYVQQLESISQPRPATAAYPEISTAFIDAFEHIREGEDVQVILDDLAAEIDSMLDQAAVESQ